VLFPIRWGLSKESRPKEAAIFNAQCDGSAIDGGHAYCMFKGTVALFPADILLVEPSLTTAYDHF
jgi:S-adenosylmethionine synthetase